MNDLFANFFVFDSNFGLTDQSPGDIIYFLSKDDQLNQDANRRFIVTGICTAIINLCKVFNEVSYCDYLITDNREISFLPIGDGLYFLLSLKLRSDLPFASCYASTIMTIPPSVKTLFKYDLNTFHKRAPNSRKQILQNVLLMIKKILFINVERPKRDLESGKFPESFKSAVNYHLPLILSCFDWNDLSFTQLWGTSVFISKLPININRDFRSKLNEFQNQNEYISGLILTNKNKIIAHTTDPEIANILNFLVSNKYHLYYPYNNLKDKENVLHWTIGFTKNEDKSGGFFSVSSKKNKNEFVNLYMPPLILNDKMVALAALRYNLVVLIIIINPKLIDVNTDLTNFKQMVEPVLIKCDSFNDESNVELTDFQDEVDSRFEKKSGAKLFCNFKRKKVQFLVNRIQSNDYDLIKNGIIFANEVNSFIQNELMKKPPSIQFLNSIENEFKEKNSSFELNNNGGFISVNSEFKSTFICENSINSTQVSVSENLSSFDARLLSVVKGESVENEDAEESAVHTKCLLPLSNGFYMFFEQMNEKLTNVFLKYKPKGITQSLEQFHAIDDRI